MSKSHVAVVGAGSFGRHHVRHLAAHQDVERVTVVDRDTERARLVADMHGATVAASADDVADLDAAVIAVPTEAHVAVAAPLLARGVHCFVEKPIAARGHEARALIAAAQEAGAVLQVGHIERFSAAFGELQEAAGPVSYIAARRHNPPRKEPPVVDVVLDLMIHDIDLALALAGQPVEAVSAFAPDGIGRECATAELRFVGGAVAHLSASRLAPVMERTLYVHDDIGVWHADLGQKTLHRMVSGELHEITLDPERDSLAVELGEFVEAACGRRTPRVDGTAGLNALAVADDIRAALAPLSLPLSA